MIDYLSQDFYNEMKNEAKSRVSLERFNHILGVRDACEWLAKTYELDVNKCCLAGVLHDMDKGLTNEQLVEKAMKFHLDEQLGLFCINNLPGLLHGPTLACELKERFCAFPEDVAHAIFVHTTASIDMSELDMCLYIADAIEVNRCYDELEHLRNMVGKVKLEALYSTVFRLWTSKLISNKKLIYPRTIDIYNNLIMKNF